MYLFTDTYPFVTVYKRILNDYKRLTTESDFPAF